MSPLAKAGCRLWTGLVVICGWVLFRSDTIKDAAAYIRTMFDPWGGVFPTDLFQISQHALILIIGIVLAAPVIPYIRDRLRERNREDLYEMVRLPALLIVAAVSVIFIIASTYNPFIYFNF